MAEQALSTGLVLDAHPAVAHGREATNCSLAPHTGNWEFDLFAAGHVLYRTHLLLEFQEFPGFVHDATMFCDF